MDQDIDYRCIKYVDKFGAQQELRPSEEQLKIITSTLREDQKIIACAGSGKTTTLVARLKYLIDHGVSPESIIISTFNVEAGRNILTKAKELIGQEKAKKLEIGNIDKIAFKLYFKFIKENSEHLLKKVRLSVKEYCFELFKFLKTRQGIKLILDKYSYFFFDEFQDVNQLQYEILLLFKRHGCYLVVIGDDAQNIYGWRDSKIDIIQTRIDKDIQQFQGTIIKRYNLSTNYRCSLPITTFSNQIIQSTPNLIQKSMRCVTREGAIFQQIPFLQAFRGLYHQNDEIINQIKFKLKKYQLKDFAILCPTNQPLKFFEEALEKHNQRSETKLEYVSFISSNQQNYQVAKTDSSLHSLNKITLSTIHRAKGLEWKVVFFIGLNDEFFPSNFLNDPNQRITKIEECRRIFYVGCTRASHELYFAVNINSKYNKVCRFFNQIREDCYERDIEISPYHIKFETNENQQKNVDIDSNVTTIISQLDHNDFGQIDQYLQDGVIEQEYQGKTIESEMLVHSQSLSASKSQYSAEKKPQISFSDKKLSNPAQKNVSKDFIIHPKCLLQEKEIRSLNLYIDLGLYIDLYIQRRFAEEFQADNGYSCEYARNVLFTLFWSGDAAEFLTKYKDFFQSPLLELTEIDSYKDFFEELEIYYRFGKGEMRDKELTLTPTEQTTLENVLVILKEFTEKYSVPYSFLNHVCCDTQSVQFKEYFPETFKKDDYVKSFQNFINPQLKTNEILRDIYTVSKCGQLQDMTRKVLYRNDFGYLNPSNLSQNVDTFIEFVKEFNYQNVKTKHVIKHGLLISGEIDMIADTTIYEIKASQYPEVSKENLLQVLTYASLMEATESIKITNIIIYNPLLGKITSFDISKWDKSSQLLDFMLSKQRQIVQDRAFGDEKKAEQNPISATTTSNNNNNNQTTSNNQKSKSQIFGGKNKQMNNLDSQTSTGFQNGIFDMPNFNEIGTIVGKKQEQEKKISKPIFNISQFSQPQLIQSKQKQNIHGQKHTAERTTHNNNNINSNNNNNNNNNTNNKNITSHSKQFTGQYQATKNQKKPAKQDNYIKLKNVRIRMSDLESDDNDDDDDDIEEFINLQATQNKNKFTQKIADSKQTNKSNENKDSRVIQID